MEWYVSGAPHHQVGPGLDDESAASEGTHFVSRRHFHGEMGWRIALETMATFFFVETSQVFPSKDQRRSHTTLLQMGHRGITGICAKNPRHRASNSVCWHSNGTMIGGVELPDEHELPNSSSERW